MDVQRQGDGFDLGLQGVLIDRLRDLSATKFVDSGFTTAAITITVFLQ